MFVKVTMTYPPDKATEVGKTFIKSVETPLPSFVKRLHVLTGTDLTGITVCGLYEVEDKKLAEGFRELVKRYVRFNTIVGFRYKIEPLLTPEETLPLVGLAPP